MKKLDPRSVIIGFLIAVIGVVSIGATNNTPQGSGKAGFVDKDGFTFSPPLENATFDRITVNEIRLNDVGMLDITDKDGKSVIVIGRDMFNGYTVLKLQNKYNKDVVSLSTTKEDDGHIVLSDRYGEGQWGMTGKRK